MRDHQHIRMVGDALPGEQCRSRRREHHDSCRPSARRPEHIALTLSETGKHGVERHHIRDVERLEELEKVFTVRAAEDAELVLNDDDVESVADPASDVPI